MKRHFCRTLSRIELCWIRWVTAFLCMDTEGGLKFVNHSALKMLGFSEQELQERGPRIFYFILSQIRGNPCLVTIALSVAVYPPGKTGFLKGFFTKKDGVLLPVEYITRTMVKGHRDHWGRSSVS